MDLLTEYQETLMSRDNESPIRILVKAFTEWHKDSSIDIRQLHARMGKIWIDCYRDHYFVLQAIWDTRDSVVSGSRLNYLAATLNKRLHGGNSNG